MCTVLFFPVLSMSHSLQTFFRFRFVFMLILVSRSALGYVPAISTNSSEEAGATDSTSRINIQWSNNGYSLFNSMGFAT